MDNKSKILEEFLSTWPLEKVRTMSLEEYSNLNKTSFTHWLESKTNDLGSIWGGSSYKFGIYRKNKSEVDKRSGYKTDDQYAWVGQYGDTKVEAFETIKNRICQVIEFSQKHDLEGIDSITLGEAYKWKIAFLYSNQSFLPIYKGESLEIICDSLGISGKETIGKMQKQILEKKKEDENIYDFANKLWAVYQSKLDDPQYWVFQCNPSEYNIHEEWKNITSDSWLVTAHKNRIKVGDRVIIWVTGKDAGCYGLCTVSSKVFQEGAENLVDISIDYNLVSQPVLKHQLIQIPAFSKFKGGNQGTNFSATKDQYYTILQMMTPNSTVPQATLPLNQILYGPPGTGKTYHTINKALEIIDGSEYDENAKRPELLKRFNQLKEEGRIGFVTFHQSFSYEDFVEGITPQLVQNEDASQTENEDTSQAENGEVKYELKEGIFKRLSRMAGGVPFEKVNKEHHYDFDSARFFKMSIGGKQKPHIHDWCIKNGKIGLGWGGDTNFQQLISSVGNWREFRDRFKVEYPHLVEESKFHVQAMHAFLKMRKGDVVLVSKGNHIIDAVGVINDDDYIYDDQQDFGYYQFRNIDWIASNLNASPELFVSKKISQQTIYEFFDEDIKRESFKKTFNSDPKNSSPENYVLIIDEINRGNVAAIFGELITLIEPDKRIGNAEALQAQLPYSKEWFGVPANLYIVGTMNTADRSVEALDTALRRRFSFEEMLPNPALIREYGVSGGIIEGIDLEKILTVINDRIEALIDRDHTIGHSYFMTVNSENDLRLVFKDKIVPLLQEYFFGDFGKIGLVLGSEFVEKVPEVTRFAVIDGYEDIAYLQKERFRLKPINKEFPIIKALSLLLGKTDRQG